MHLSGQADSTNSLPEAPAAARRRGWRSARIPPVFGRCSAQSGRSIRMSSCGEVKACRTFPSLDEKSARSARSNVNAKPIHETVHRNRGNHHRDTEGTEKTWSFRFMDALCGSVRDFPGYLAKPLISKISSFRPFQLQSTRNPIYTDIVRPRCNPSSNCTSRCAINSCRVSSSLLAS